MFSLKRGVLISLLLLFSSIMIHAQVAQIISISNNIVPGQGSQTSSLGGGTTLYLQGSGFDPILSNNQVFINGSFPAVVQSTTTAYLLIVTPAIFSAGVYSLTLIIPGVTVQCICTCSITYQYSSTPEFIQLWPTSGSPGDTLTIFGLPKTNLASNVGFRLINTICVSSDTATNDRSLSMGSRYTFTCQIPQDLTPGYYPMVISAKPQGLAVNYPSFTIYNSLNVAYNFQCVPTITSINSNIGSPLGQIINITGNGFSSPLSVSINGSPCSLTKWSFSNIQCQIPPFNDTPNGVYIQGRGLQRTLYNIGGLDLHTFENTVWNNSATTPISESLVASFDKSSYETNVFEVYSGYFRAPASGAYTFFLYSDSYCEVYLSSIANSSSPANLAQIIAWNQTIQTIPTTYNLIASQEINLNKSDLYLIQTFKQLVSNPSYIRLAVETPLPTHNYQISVQTLTLSYSPIREQMEISIYNWHMGSFQIVIQGVDPASGTLVYYRITKVLPYNISATDFATSLANDLGFGPTSVARFNLNKTGGMLNSSSPPSNIAGFMFQINLTIFRDNYNGTVYMPRVIPVTFDSIPKIVVTELVPPTPCLSGSYSLLFNDVLLSNINVNNTCIDGYLSLIPGYNHYVTCEMFGSPIEDRTYVITFGGFQGPVPVLQIVSSQLFGGIPSQPPEISLVEISNGTSQGYYRTIPDDFLVQGEDSEFQLYVESNGVLSKCPNDNCGYKINETATPILLDYNLTTVGLNLLLDNYQSYNITTDTITVQFALSTCTNLTISLPYVNCSIPTNPDGSLILAGGAYMPLVHIWNIGYAVYGPNVLPTTMVFNLSGLNLEKGSIMGGQTVLMTGSGFPPSIEGLIVSFGMSIASVVNVSNTEMVVITQEQTNNDTVIINFNGAVATYDLYLYDVTITPVISSISPTEASPVQKGVLTIQGTLFGNDINNIAVFLDKEDNTTIYQLGILSFNSTAGEIKAVLSGGSQGIYTVRVNVAGIGNSIPSNVSVNVFTYDLAILSVSPNRGSLQGGTILTITGKNFSPVLNENQVYIGDLVNSFCDVFFSNETVIQCTTLPCDASQIEQSLTVYVTQRVQEQAVCQDTINQCLFEFTIDSTPQITLNQEIINVVEGDQISLSGSKMSSTGEAVLTLFDVNGVEVIVINSNSLTETQLNFTMPALVDGVYNVSVVIPSVGEVTFINFPSLALNNTLAIIEITMLDNSSIVFPYVNAALAKGGVYLAIKTNGLLSSDSIYIQNSGYCIRKNEYQSNLFICRTSNLTITKTNYTIFIYRGSNIKITCDSCYFNILTLLSFNVQSNNLTTQYQGSNFTMMLSGTGFSSSAPNMTLDSYDVTFRNMIDSFQGTIVSFNTTSIIANFGNIPLGKYFINGYVQDQGFLYFSSLTVQSIAVNFQSFSVNPIHVGYFAGPWLTILSEEVLFPKSQGQTYSVTVCGLSCPVKWSKDISPSLSCKVPTLLPKSSSKFSQKTDNSNPNWLSSNEFSASSDNNNTVSIANTLDGNPTTYYDSSNALCFIEYDFGANFTTNLYKIQYSFNFKHQLTNYNGLIFQYSPDKISYFNLFVLGSSVNFHSGLNLYKLPANSASLQTIRIISPTANHPSRCQLSEINFFGTKQIKNISATSQVCDVVVTGLDNQKYVISGKVQFQNSLTPSIISINPTVGKSVGGDLITIIGTGFGTDTTLVEVLLSGVNCNVQFVNDSTIQCATGIEENAMNDSSVNVFINGNQATTNGNGLNFYYANYWSDCATWGGEAPPRTGDSVYIPAGQSILLDCSAENLNAVVIQGGRLIFKDQNIVFSANYLVCIDGEIQIGTEDTPILSQISITMLGNSQNTQLPIYGNKVWALQDSILEMHGKTRSFYRSVLTKTAQIGDETITVLDLVDWVPGDVIAISTNTLQASENEVRTIVSINNNNIVLDSPLSFLHNVVSLQYNGLSISKECYVLLLTRNIVLNGQIDDNSLGYGMHLYVSGQSVIRIENAEFTHMGQKNFLNRYPINIINVQDASSSYIRENSLHDNFARAVSLENTNYLTISNNIAFNNLGSSYVLSTGTETNNQFINNFACMVTTSLNLMNLDLLPSGFYISNPANAFINNTVISSDYAGFNFDLKANSLLDPQICPVGVPLMHFQGNKAIGNQYFGLYIYQYMPRSYPCLTQSNANLEDPFSQNPGVQAEISDFLTYQNGFNGVLAEYVANIDFLRISVLDCVSVGVQVSDTRYTYVDGVKLMDSLIFGSIDSTASLYAIITPRTDNFFVSNVSFVNFSNSQSAAIYTCSKCASFKMNGGKTTKFQSLYFENVLQRVLLGGYKTEIIWDLDGTLTNVIGGAMMTGYMNHLSGIPSCFNGNASVYDVSIICNVSVKIRTLQFRNMVGSGSFSGLPMKIFRLPSLDFNVSSLPNNMTINFTSQTMKNVWADTSNAWVIPFVTGANYNIHWLNGTIDFTHMSVSRSPYWSTGDAQVILKFNCSNYKDDYIIKVLAPNTTNLTNCSNVTLQTIETSSLGSYNFNNYTLDFYLAINSQFLLTDYIDVTTFRYPVTVPGSNTSNGSIENLVPQTRYWSNASLWPSGAIPVDEEDVTIPRLTTIYLDIDTAQLGTLIIDGILIFESTSILRLNAQRIWVRSGKLIAGNASNPYLSPIEINLLGGQFSDDLVIDSFIDSGNKILAITGELSLVSEYPQQLTTKLSQIASPGEMTITVNSPVNDWNIGDSIVIGPTEGLHSSGSSSEVRMIVSIINNGYTIVLDQALTYLHYGSLSLFTNDEGLSLDMRAKVGLLSRNIKIQGDQQNNWGCNIMVYEYLDIMTQETHAGTAYLDGVQIQYCGQSDTSRSSFDVKYVHTNPIVLKGSSISFAYGWGVNLVTSNHITLENNIIYSCQNYLIRIYYANYFDIINNLLIDALTRNLPQNTGYYDMVAGVYFEASMVYVNYALKNNFIQGSLGNGFVIPGTNCLDALNGFTFNQANSIIYAGFLIMGNNTQCLELRNFTVYSSGVGVLSDPPASGLLIKSGILAENQKGIYSSFLNDNNRNIINYVNLDFFAIVRSDCQECYLSASQCSYQTAITIPVITISSVYNFPIYGDSPLVLLKILSDAAFDQELFISNTTFHNYQSDSTGIFPELSLPSCVQNLIFSMLPYAPDAMCSIYLNEVTSINSAAESFFKLSPPDMDFLGIQGGCGNFNCTGQNNWILTDVTGDFLNEISQIIPQQFGLQAYQCQSISNWNATECAGMFYGILHFENSGVDQRLRPLAPINISSLQIPKNILNQWKEWSYQGNIPMNRRLSRFQGIVELNVTTTVSFVVTVPQMLMFELESYYSQDYLLINLQYERPNVIQVLKGSTLIASQNGTADLLGSYRECGSNFYDSTSNKISFIITSEEDCVLTVRTVNYVSVSLRMQTTLQDFYTTDNIATFIDKISTFLGIDFSRLRIAGLRTGSVIVDFQVLEDTSKFKNMSDIDPYDANSVNQALNTSFNDVWNDFAAIIDKFVSNVNSSYGLQWPVMDIQLQPMVSNPQNFTIPTQNYTSFNLSSTISSNNSNNTNNLIIVAENKNLPAKNGDTIHDWELILILSLILPTILITVIITCCCVKTKEGISLFRMILKRICTKKSQVYPRRNSLIVPKAKNSTQIVPGTFDGGVFDIEDSQHEKNTEIMMSPPSNVMSPIKSNKKDPYIFRKDHCINDTSD